MAECDHKHWVCRSSDPIGYGFCDDCKHLIRLDFLFNALYERLNAAIAKAEALNGQ